MKATARVVGIVMATFISSGCFIQSVKPFYTEQAKAELRGVEGRWRPVQTGKDDAAKEVPKPWIFSQTTIKTWEDGVASMLEVTYFKLNNVFFVDLIAGDPTEKGAVNGWWGMHVMPVHSVCKVELQGDSLAFTPLDGEWVAEELKAGRLKLSFITVGEDEDQIVLTASSADMARFLAKNGKNARAFPPDSKRSFEKVP